MILDRINSPEDVKRLDVRELEELAREIREVILEVTSKNGGHVAPNLGAVELTLALHYVYESPRDKIIWDVGHQAYAHKLLTGRKERFHTLRKLGGISGFTNRKESPHDPFGAGHASTAISAALGFALARDRLGEDFRVVAVVGDGALTGGMAMEALNWGGHVKADITIILNDNKRSISENVGGVSNYLAKLSSHKFYHEIKNDIKELVERLPDRGIPGKIRTLAWKIKESIKNLAIPTILFEELGYEYIGPIDGHNIKQLVDTLQRVRELRGPILVHVITEKGHGYEPAIKNPELFHGLGPFDLKTGQPKKSPGPPKWSNVFGDTLTQLAERNPKIVAITAAMTLGTGLAPFRERHPDRLFDVGIAEQHAVTMAAGMAFGGLIPAVAIYSTFLQRAFDQLIHDVALQEAPVRFFLDRAGLVGDDGPTHHGVFDIAYLRLIPNMVIMAPRDEPALQDMIYTAINYQGGPIATRYPRGRAWGAPKKPVDRLEEIPIGKGELLREGDGVWLVALGSMVYPALRAAEKLEQEGVRLGVVDARFAKPIDTELLAGLPGRIITVEEGCLAGGFGSGVHDALGDKVASIIGIPDEFVEAGEREELLALLGLDAEGIAKRVKKIIKNKSL